MKKMLNLILLIVICSIASSQTKNIQQSLKSKYLSETRFFQIHLPDNYHRDTSKRFPVLYVLDAEYVFNYATGIVDFLSNGFGHLPKMIVVGIPNTDRGKDFYFSLSDAEKDNSFVSFLELELMSYISENYRSNSFSMLYGWSSASNINFKILLDNTNLFDAHILSGTGIGPKTAAFLSSKMMNSDRYKGFLHASTESPGLRVLGLENYEKVMRRFYPTNQMMRFEKLENTSHVDVLAKGLEQGLKFIFEDFYISEEDVEKGAKNILSYYEKIQDKYPVTFQIPEGAIIESISTLQGSGKIEEIKELLNFAIKSYPKSSEIFGLAGEIYEYLKDNKSAANYYKIAADNSKNDPITFHRYNTLYLKLHNN